MVTSQLSVIQKNKIIDILRSNGVSVGYLFGSYVRGTAGHLSDIDIGVAFPKDSDIFYEAEKIEDIRASLEKIFGKDKVDVVNTPRLRKPLLKYIITLGEGVLLFADDVSLKTRLVDLARREFEDTRPLRSIQFQALKSLF
jgi:predicted nucleotidyltransferase